jgi:hypothetical protein
MMSLLVNLKTVGVLIVSSRVPWKKKLSAMQGHIAPLENQAPTIRAYMSLNAVVLNIPMRTQQIVAISGLNVPNDSQEGL